MTNPARHLQGLDPMLGTLADLTLELRTNGETRRARFLLLRLSRLAELRALEIGIRLEARR